MLDSFFEPGVTGVSPFAIIISLYLAYYVHNDARNHNNRLDHFLSTVLV